MFPTSFTFQSTNMEFLKFKLDSKKAHKELVDTAMMLSAEDYLSRSVAIVHPDKWRDIRHQLLEEYRDNEVYRDPYKPLRFDFLTIFSSIECPIDSFLIL